MSHEDNLSPADREFEDALRSLAPATARIDPIAAAFEAGAMSTRSRVRVWQSLAAIMLIVLVGTWTLPAPRSRNSVNVNFVEAVSPITVQPVSAQSVLVLQKTVRDHGIDALPRTEVPAMRGFDAKDLF
jgi:hypothetical protein